MPTSRFYNSRSRSPVADPTPQEAVITQEQQAVNQIDQESKYQDLVQKDADEQAAKQREIEAAASKAETARKSQLAAQKRVGIETEYDAAGREDIRRHDDGTPVFKAGWVGKPQPDDQGRHIAKFRNTKGVVAPVDLNAIQRTPDAAGQEFDEFDVNGEKIRYPVSATNPLFKIGPTGNRYSEVQDPRTGGYVQENLGIDKRAANVAAITRKKADYDKLKQQRTFETQNLDMERTTSATNFEPVREKFTAAQTEAKKFQRGRRYEQTPDGLVSIDRNNGEDFRSPVSSNDTAEIAKANAWLNSKKTADATLEAARAEHDPAKKRLYDLEVKRNTLAEQALRESQRHQTELADMEEATKAGLDITKPQWKATLDFARKDPRYQQIVAAGEYADQGSDLASAINAAVAKVKAPNYVEAREEPLSIAQRVLRDLSANAPRENYVDPNAAPDTARMEAEGEKRALVDAIAAGITTGKPAPDAKDMATASDIAAKSLGVTDPEKWSLTPSSMGDFDLHHADSDMVVGRLDPENKRILLYPSATLGEAGKQLMEKASRDGFPVYHMGSSEAPMTPQELRDYVANGINIARMAGTQDERDAALEQAGITAADVREKVMSGRMSVQDGQWLNEKLFEVRELDNSPEGYTKGFREYIGSNPEAAKIMQGGTPEMKAAVVNRYADARARSTGNNLFLDRDTLADRRMELEQQVAGKGKLAKAGAFVKETLAPMLGIFGQAGAYIPQKIAKWSGNETTAGRLSEQQFEDWMKRTPSYLDRINKRPEVAFAVDEFKQWAVRARPGETPPDELASKIAREVYAGYHQLTDETAKALDTTEDTFNVNKDPKLSAMLQRYLETANPAHFTDMVSMMVSDARDRKTQGEVMQYVERPHAATPADVATRAKELNLPMTEGGASALLGLSKSLDAAKDPKQIEAIITQAGKVMGTTTRDDTLLALHTLTTQATDDPQSWWGLMKGGFVAGRQELATELVTTGLEAGVGFLTAGAATPEILAAKAARQGVKTGMRAALRRTATSTLNALSDESKLFAATRNALGRARTAIGTTIVEEADKFAKAGMKSPKFGQPLSKLDKASNLAVATGKGIVAGAPMEAIEEGIASVGEADPTLEGTLAQMGMGAMGAGLITPIFTGVATVANAFRARGATAEYEKQKAGWVAKFNDRMAGAPGFKPITTADFDTWQALQDNPAHQSAVAEYASALGELEAAQADPIATVAAQARVEAAAEHLAGLSEVAFQAADELRAIPEAERPLYTGAAKAAAGATDFTAAEATALIKQSGVNAVAFRQAEVLPADVAGPRNLKTLADLPDVKNVAPSVYRLPAGVQIDVPAPLLDTLRQAAPSMVDLMGATQPMQPTAVTVPGKSQTSPLPGNQPKATKKASKQGKVAPATVVNQPVSTATPPATGPTTTPQTIPDAGELADSREYIKKRVSEGLSRDDAVREHQAKRDAFTADLEAQFGTGAQVQDESGDLWTKGADGKWRSKGEATGLKNHAARGLGALPGAKVISTGEQSAATKPATTPPAKTAPPPGLEQLARRVIGETVAKSPKLKSIIVEAKKPAKGQTGGMWYSNGVVSYHMDTLLPQLANLTPQKAAQRVAKLLDEEIRHAANMEAARRLYKKQKAENPMLGTHTFEDWLEVWYGDIWNNHFTPEMRAKVAEERTRLVGVRETDVQLAFEGLRMIDQLRATGSITEAVLEALEALMGVLREFLDLVTAGSKPVVQGEINRIRAVLEEYGYEKGTVKPEKAKKQPKKPKKKDTPKSSTQFTLSPADARPVIDFAASIPDDELAPDSAVPGAAGSAREDEPHVTVLYGLTEHDAAPVAEVIADHGPVTLTLGKLSVFANDEYDVLKVDVESPSLRALNAKIAKLPNENSFPDYRPHMTIAYLKKGEGAKYVGDTRFEGKELTFDTMTFSPPSEMRKELGRPELPLTNANKTEIAPTEIKDEAVSLESPKAPAPFDSEAFNQTREDAIKASKKAGNTHLDQLTPSVETMRGKVIYYAHDPKQRGVIRTVDNSGNVYVHWSDEYSAGKELASETVEDNRAWLKSSSKLPYLRRERGGKVYVMASTLGKTDLKDYVLEQPAKTQPDSKKEAVAETEPPLSETAQKPADLSQSTKPKSGASAAAIAKAKRLKDKFGLASAPAPHVYTTGLPREKEARDAFSDLAEMLIDDSVTEPTKLALFLDEVSPDGSMRKYADAMWSTLRSVDPSLPRDADWSAIYAGIDGLEAPSNKASWREEMAKEVAEALKAQGVEGISAITANTPPKAVAPKETPERGDTVTWTDGAGKQAISMIGRIDTMPDGAVVAWVDWFGRKTVPLDQLTLKAKGNQRVARERREADEAAKAGIPKAEVTLPEYAKEKKPADNKALREMKRYLLEKLDDAIADAPDEKQLQSVRQDLAVLIGLADKSSDPKNHASLTALREKYNLDPKATKDQISKAIHGSVPPETKVIIEIPGDGTFTLWNDKKTLKEFATKAKSFPSSVPKSDLPTLTKINPTGIPALNNKKLTKADVVKIAGMFVSSDETRQSIQQVADFGNEIVATDGRILFHGPFEGLGQADDPMLYHAKGALIGPQSKFETKFGAFPKWQQVLPKNLPTIHDGIDTGRLWQVLKQASAVFKDAKMDRKSAFIKYSDATPFVSLYLNPDKSIGVSGVVSDTFEGYEHNKQDGAQFIGHFDADLLMAALQGLRALGQEKTALNRDMENTDGGALVLVTPAGEVVVMATKAPKVKAAEDVKAAQAAMEPTAAPEETRTPKDVWSDQYFSKLLEFKKAGGEANSGILNDTARKAELAEIPPDKVYRDFVDAGVTTPKAVYSIQSIWPGWIAPSEAAEQAVTDKAGDRGLFADASRFFALLNADTKRRDALEAIRDGNATVEQIDYLIRVVEQVATRGGNAKDLAPALIDRLRAFGQAPEYTSSINEAADALAERLYTRGENRNAPDVVQQAGQIGKMIDPELRLGDQIDVGLNYAYMRQGGMSAGEFANWHKNLRGGYDLLRSAAPRFVPTERTVAQKAEPSPPKFNQGERVRGQVEGDFNREGTVDSSGPTDNGVRSYYVNTDTVGRVLYREDQLMRLDAEQSPVLRTIRGYIGKMHMSGLDGISDSDVFADPDGTRWILKMGGDSNWQLYKQNADGTIDYQTRHPIFRDVPSQIAFVRMMNEAADDAPASNPPASDQQDNEAKAVKSGIADFGEKLGGARKDKVATVEQELTDDEIAGKTLSEIWPKSEIDSIEDIDKAAFATAIRDEIPTKPQRGYKLRAWVEKVKFVKGLMRYANEKGVAEMLDIMRGPQYNLASFADKITLLQAVEREQWGRIGKVEHHPNAYRYGEGATKIPSPHATAEVDGRLIREETLEKLTEAVSAKVSEGKPVAKMQFEVRGRAGAWGINKKGDPLYRKLKTFEDSKEAIEFVKNNHADLVSAWEAVKERDNIKETDLRKSTNRPRTAEDYRQGRDATPEMFQEAFGFRGVEFGNWVSQGANAKERQGMMNEAYDALHDLASILNIPTRALSLDGQIGLGFGSRGQGWASAHYEPGNLVINLTKTRGAGSLAHELFHAFDHYFQRQRGVSIANGRGSYITEQPETRYVDQTTGHTLSVERFNQIKERGRFRNEADWKLMEGVRPEVEEAFTALVKALDESPMAKRASLNDKGKQGYWGSVIERAARSFENYVIYKMQQKGYQNDYLANVVRIEEFARDPGRYPYLLDEEIEPVAKAFDDLFATIKTKETEKGIALYSAPSSMPRDRAESIVRNLGKVRAVRELRPDEAKAFAEAEGVLASAPSPQDAEYMAAVESGDVAEQQRLVDEAARKAGYNVAVSHGTDEQRNEFDGGAFFTDSKEDASAYAEMKALERAAENNEDLMDIINDIMSEEGMESITDMGPEQIREIADANGIKLEASNGVVLNGKLRLINPLDLTEYGTDVGNLPKLWNELHADGLVDEKWEDIDEEFQDEMRDKYRDVALYRLLEEEGIQAKAFSKGHDAVVFEDISPGGGSSHTSWLTKSNTQFKSTAPITRDDAGNVIPLSKRFDSESRSILYAAPAPKKPKDPQAAAMREALDSMQPIWREVIENVVHKGEPIEAFAKRKNISVVAAGNALKYASGRLNVLMAAHNKTLKPVVQVEKAQVKAASGRPDLAMSGNPAFVAVDQIRGTPEEVTHQEMNELAERMFAVDPVAAEKLVVRWMDSGMLVIERETMPAAIQAILSEAEARTAGPMLLTAAAKLLTTEKALSGGDSLQSARLIDLYRTTGTEQARALGMRYDPHTSPEERNAMYIQEALLTPPQSMRNEMKRNPANKLRILAEWARRAEALKEQLKAEGFDLDATFAEYRKEQKLAEATVPQEVRIPLSRAPGKTRKLIKAVLEGKTWGEAAEAAKLTFADARKAYNAFRDTINQAGVKAAQQAKDVLLRSAPAPGDFAAQLGLPEWLEHASPDYAPTKNKATEELKKERKRPKKAGTVDLNNPVAVARATRKIAIAKSTAFDAMSEFWRASILSGPQTHVVNFVSAALYGTYETTFKKLATGTMGDIARMFGMQSDAASLSDLPAMMAATFPAIQEAFRDGIRSLKTDTRTFEAYARGPQPDGSTFKGDVYDPALGGLLGKVMRGISFRAMTAADELVKSFFTRIEVAAQARQIARSEGLTGKAMADRIAVLLRPGSDAWIRALDHAHQITFQTELKTHNRAIDQLDGLANIISRAKKGDFGALPKGTSHFIFPFVATPANIFKTGLTMSPLGALLSIIDAARAYDMRRKGNEQEAARIFNAARLLDDLANQIVAWGALYALSSLVKPGEDDDDLPFVTGTMPWTSTAKGERDLAYRTAPPLSIRVGDRWYSYKRLDPFASALSFMVDAVKELQSGKPIEESWASIAGSVLRNTQEKTFLQGFGDLMNMLHDPQRYGSRWATNIATGFVPNLIRQPIRSADPYIRESDLPNDMGFWSALGHRVGYGIYPQAAMPKVDVWGNPASKDTGTGGPLTDTLLRLFSPVDTRDGSQPDPLDVALLRYNLTHEDNQFAMTAPRREIQRKRGNVEVRFSLNDAEYNEMARESGQAARRALGSAFNHDLDEAQMKRVKAVVEKYHELATEKAFRRKVSEMAKP